MSLYISSYGSITSDGVSSNGKQIMKNECGDDFESYFKSIYKNLNPAYAKFYKMDNLSKLAFLAGELVLDKALVADVPSDEIALVVGNRNASLDTDKKHQASFSNRNNYFPSPAIFVYTLPNIMLGELCIRHKIQGESSCFLMPDFDAQFFNDYVHDLFESEGYTFCLTGWIDFDPTKYSAHLLLVNGSDSKGTSLLFDKHLKQIIP